MKAWQKSLALLLAITLLVTCGIAGIVLPASAENTTATDLLNGAGSFDSDDWKSSILSDLNKDVNSVVADPTDPSNQVLQLGNGEGGVYTVTSYFKFNHLYNDETGLYNKGMEAGKSYTLEFDVYGAKIESYINYYEVTADSDMQAGWTAYGGDASGWKHYKVTFYPIDDIASKHAAWREWYFSLDKDGKHGGETNAVTYVDNFVLTETKATGVQLSETEATAKPGETLTLTATAVPARSAIESFAWSSNNEAVATVKDGVVTAKKNGTATITVTAGTLSATCTVKVNDNLFPDGDFEGTADGNVFTGGLNSYLSIQGNVGYGGSKALVFSGDVAANKDQYVRADRVALESNSRYFVDYMVKGAVENDLQFYVQGLTNCSVSGQYTVNCGDGWVMYRRVLTTTEDPKISNYSFAFIKRSSTTNPIYVDNFSIRKVTDSVNLLTNESEFDYLGWEWYNHVTKGYVEGTTDPADSSNSVLKVNTATGAAHASLWAVPVQADTDYTLTFRAKGAQLAAYFSYTTNGKYWHYTTASTDWQEYTWHFTTDSAPNGNYIVDFGRLSGGDEAYIDDICLVKTQYATDLNLTATGDTTMTLGRSSLTLAATAMPEGSYLKENVVWTSNNTDVATVADGVVTAKKGGTAVITATSGTLSKSITVTVNYPTEHFVNGSMDTSTDGIHLSADSSKWSFATGEGYNGGTALALNTAMIYYIDQQTYYMRPNSVYEFSVLARTDAGGSATVRLDKASFEDVEIASWAANINSNWKRVIARLKTGDNPRMDPSYGTIFNVTALSGGKLYIDNISLKLVESNDARFPTNDFEVEDMSWDTYGQVVSGVGMDGSNALELPNSKGTRDLFGTINYLDSQALYKLSFYTRVDQTWIDEKGSMKLYWGSGNAKGNNVITATGSYFKMTTEWQLNEFIISTGSATVLPDNVFYFDCTTTGNGHLYIDNATFQRIDTGNTITAFASNCDINLRTATAAKASYLTDLAAGTEVTVQVYPYTNKIMVPGTLKLTMTDGTEIPILNKNNDTFGDGDGTYFSFIMPEGSGQVSVTMQDATTDSYAMDSIGTSVHDNGEGSYDGVRFLTRMNVTSFAASEDGMTVTYNGATATVMEIGSLLVREGNEATLTYDDAKWKAVAYKKGEIDTMKLVDYTSRYIDFSSVMMTTYTDRRYSAKGYMCLDTDNDGVADATVYSTNYQTDSIDSAVARL